MTSIAVEGTGARADRRARSRRAPAHDGPEPWVRRDRVVLAALAAISVIGLGIGWFGVSDTVDLDDQTRWLSFGIAALMLGGFGMLSWLLTGLRSVTLLRVEVLAELDRRHPVPVRTKAGAPTGTGFGTVTGMRRFHAADCLMLEGKDVHYAAAEEHAAAGLRPCGVCLADAPAEAPRG